MAAGGAFVGFAFLSNFDVILANSSSTVTRPASTPRWRRWRRSSSSSQALWLSDGARAAKARAGTGDAAPLLRVSALAVLAATIGVALPAVLAPHFVIETMFGPDYDDASGGVPPIALAGLGLALMYLLVVYTVAIKDRRWVLLLIEKNGVQVAAILLYQGFPAQVATAQAVTVSTSCCWSTRSCSIRSYVPGDGRWRPA